GEEKRFSGNCHITFLWIKRGAYFCFSWPCYVFHCHGCYCGYFELWRYSSSRRVYVYWIACCVSALFVSNHFSFYDVRYVFYCFLLSIMVDCSDHFYFFYEFRYGVLFILLI